MLLIRGIRAGTDQQRDGAFVFEETVKLLPRTLL